jgi:hypothetical protein
LRAPGFRELFFLARKEYRKQETENRIEEAEFCGREQNDRLEAYPILLFVASRDVVSLTQTDRTLKF